MPDSNDIKKRKAVDQHFFADPAVFLNANSDQFIKVCTKLPYGEFSVVEKDKNIAQK